MGAIFQRRFSQAGGCLTGSVVITAPLLWSNGRSATSPLAGTRVYIAQVESTGGGDGVGAKGLEVVSVGGTYTSPALERMCQYPGQFVTLHSHP